MAEFAGSMNYGSSPDLTKKPLGLESFGLDLNSLTESSPGYGLEGIAPYQANRDFSSLGKFGVMPGGEDSGFNFEMPSLQGVGTALKGAGTAAQAYLSWRNLREGRKQAGIANQFATTNLANQVKITRAQQADRQRTRVAGDTAGRYQSVADYMAQYGVSGSVA